MMPGENKPYLPSAIALVGLFIITAVTAQMGFDYWSERRGDSEMAWISLGCELVAFGGIAAAMFGWPDRRAWVATGVTLAVSMSVVCGWTAYQRLAEDEHSRAIEAVQQTEAYGTAKEDLDEARGSVRAWSVEDPRPTCECPQTIAAWSIAHVAEADRREAVLAQRQSRVDALVPETSISAMALARAIGLESAKLLGFGAFGGVWLYAFRQRRTTKVTSSSSGGASPPVRASTISPPRCPPSKQRPKGLPVHTRARAAQPSAGGDFADWDDGLD